MSASSLVYEFDRSDGYLRLVVRRRSRPEREQRPQLRAEELRTVTEQLEEREAE